MTSPNDPNVQPGASLAPNPDAVNEFHRYSDVDNSPDSHHHTLGIDPNQGAAGDHDHDGRNSKLLASTSHTHSQVPSSIQFGSSVVTTDANGQARVTYPVSFSARSLSVVATYGDGTQGLVALWIHDITNTANDSKTGFTFRSGSVNTTLRINWIAVGE